MKENSQKQTCQGNFQTRCNIYHSINGNMLNINGSVTGSQIQQGTSNSNQNMTIDSKFDYDEVLKILTEIQGFFEMNKFQEDFGEYTEEMKNVVTETLTAVKKKEDSTIIKTALNTIKDISLRVSSSLIATGIIGLLNQLPFL